MSYTVWIEITTAADDGSGDDYKAVGLPDVLANFDEEAAAQAYVDLVHLAMNVERDRG